jgi:hypothetical protein
MFRARNLLKQSVNQPNLMTKEIVFALHSDQKETLIQECVYKIINEKGKDQLRWNDLKKYCVSLWYDQTNEIKQFIEIIAKNKYTQEKEANDAALWYILSNKK